MPRIDIPGPFKISFYSSDCSERVHVHVEFQGKKCKIWLDPIAVATKGYFKPHQLNVILKLVEKYETEIKEAWHDHCGEEKD